ncbi:hypothetical protein GJU43_12450 [Flavobacterium sp. LC2016-23]|uniref:hypothetical protein n=1 Tax=Flavobacterium sp. LC2016-23 TaxID=2666330 RepID=UPI0012AFEEC0|nr:hypothetical protein [Flavobacterium sp. LC2016-23]MRX40089.1 hypothetical protein [Flavobacterium sp. LC2016-23]
MKTQQRIIWINCLVNGISTISTMFITACSSPPPEYFITTTYIYKNLTSETITISLFNEDNILLNEYIIYPSEEELIIIKDAGKIGLVQPFIFRNNKYGKTTNVIIDFAGNNKCLTFLEGQGILDVKSYDNFTESMYDKSNNTLIYTIDDSELNLSIPCL